MCAMFFEHIHPLSSLITPSAPFLLSHTPWHFQAVQRLGCRALAQHVFDPEHWGKPIGLTCNLVIVLSFYLGQRRALGSNWGRKGCVRAFPGQSVHTTSSASPSAPSAGIASLCASLPGFSTYFKLTCKVSLQDTQPSELHLAQREGLAKPTLAIISCSFRAAAGTLHKAAHNSDERCVMSDPHAQKRLCIVISYLNIIVPIRRS